MTIDKNSIVYLDAVFLINIFAKKVTDTSKQKNAQQLFAQLLISKCRLLISPLSLDEFWAGFRVDMVIWWRQRLSKIFKPLGLKLANEGIFRISYAKAQQSIKHSTNQLLSNTRLSLAQIQHPNIAVNRAVNYLDKLQPRDSFHLTIAVENLATHIVTLDKKFEPKIKEEGLDVIPF